MCTLFEQLLLLCETLTTEEYALNLLKFSSQKFFDPTPRGKSPVILVRLCSKKNKRAQWPKYGSDLLIIHYMY